MTANRPLAALVLATAALLSVPLIQIAPAQDGSPIPRRNADPSQPSVRDQWQAAQISLDFPGGTVRQYVDALRKAAATMPVNINFSGNAEDASLPPVLFRNVQIETAIRTIGQLETRPGMKLSVREVTNDRVESVGPGMVRQPGGPVLGVPLYVVSLDPAVDRGNRASRVISLNDIIAQRAGDNPLPAEVVLSAIETALERDAARVDMRFHKDSGLLFVSGDPAQCELANEVVTRLRDDVRRGSGVGAVGKPPQMETFRLAHVDTARVADAIRVAFPSDPRWPDPVQVAPDPNTNSVVIAAQEPLMVAVRSVIRSLDRRQEDNKEVADLRANESQARRQVERAEMEAARMRDEAAKCAEQAGHARAEIEVLRARSDEIGRQRDMAEKSRQELEQNRRNLRDEIQQLQSQLAKAVNENTLLQQQMIFQGGTKPK